MVDEDAIERCPVELLPSLLLRTAAATARVAARIAEAREEQQAKVPLVTTRKIAEAVGVHEKTIRRRIDDGTLVEGLHFFRIGRKLLFDATKVDACALSGFGSMSTENHRKG